MATTVAMIAEAVTGVIASTAAATSCGSNDLAWILLIGFIAGFFLAFSVGANDVANSFGTAVGAKVLTLRQAFVLATIFETSGAVLLGARVGETIRKGIVDVEVYDYDGGQLELMRGQVSAMFGSGLWQIIATILAVPVSGTHSIVGACVGFSLVSVGFEGIQWHNLAFVVASWFISPLLSGIFAAIVFYFVKKFIVDAKRPLNVGLKCLPLFYAATIGMNTLAILFTGAPLIGLNQVPGWGNAIITVGVMFIVWLTITFVVVPKIRERTKLAVRLERIEEVDFEEVLDKAGLSGSDGSRMCRRDDDDHDDETSCRSQPRSESRFSSRVTSEFGGSCKVLQVELEDEETENSALVADDEAKRNVAGGGHREAAETDDPNRLALVRIPSTRTKVVVQVHKDRDCKTSRKSTHRKSVLAALQQAVSVDGDLESRDEKKRCEDEDPVAVREMFSLLQILTSCFGSFAHGGNDVSNAIGPLVAMWMIFWTGSTAQKVLTPWYILLYGGCAISVGLWMLGSRVIRTIGNDITRLTPSRGFCIEVTTAFTVLVASNIGIPVSTTHCKVGGVMAIGFFRKSENAIDWSVMRKIAYACVVTIPASGLLSAFVMVALTQFTKHDVV